MNVLSVIRFFTRRLFKTQIVQDRKHESIEVIFSSFDEKWQFEGYPFLDCTSKLSSIKMSSIFSLASLFSHH